MDGLDQLSMALLVLLPGAAGTRIVATDLRAVAQHRFRHRHHGLLGLHLGGFLVRAVSAGIGVLELHLLRLRLRQALVLGFQSRDFKLESDKID